MKSLIRYFIFSIAIIFMNLSYANAETTAHVITIKEKVVAQNVKLHDTTRNRLIPVEIYFSPKAEATEKRNHIKSQVVIISPGNAMKNTEYSFIADKLAEEGYFVASIQQQLETDPELAQTGNIMEDRKPLWETGSENISFVITSLKKRYSNLDLSKVILIGHSHGGDISMFFATEHPKMVSKIISLDSLRYPFPTSDDIPILVFQSNDKVPDPDVYSEEDVKVIKIDNAKHIDLSDRGSADVKNEVSEDIVDFLK